MKFAKCADQTRKLSWSNQKGESTFWSLDIILKSCVAIKTNYFVCINVDSKLAEKLEYFSRLKQASQIACRKEPLRHLMLVRILKFTPFVHETIFVEIPKN